MIATLQLCPGDGAAGGLGFEITGSACQLEYKRCPLRMFHG